MRERRPVTRAATHSGEFGRIARYFAPLASAYRGAFGLRDDAAVLAPRTGHELVVTTDSIVAGVHYIGNEPAGRIAQKLLRVNLSDLAAMGAEPLAYTLNIALPSDTGDLWVEEFASGLAEDQARYGVVLIGGDSVGTPGPAVFTLTAFGEVPVGKALRRNGARVGDVVYVSGTIGDAALGLQVLQNNLFGVSGLEREALACRYELPDPRTGLGHKLLGIASAAADISDGLVADLAHIAEASGVAAKIDKASVPVSSAAGAALSEKPALWETILSGGDDYELIFCAATEHAASLRALSAEIDVALTAVGEIVGGAGVRVFDPSGVEVTLTRAGFTHD